MTPEEALKLLKVIGGKMNPIGPEGQRMPGHCVYCAGPCVNATDGCEARVFNERCRLDAEKAKRGK